MLAIAKARSAPRLLRKAAAMSYLNRWTAIMSVAAQRAFETLLLDLPFEPLLNLDGAVPPLEATLLDSRLTEAPEPSRLS